MIRQRKPIPKVSARQKLRLAKYEKAKKEWNEFINCGCAFPRCKARASSTPHHSRGRVASLLWDKRFFIGLCVKHHIWVHDNPGEARAFGLLCQPGQWNTPVK